LSAPQGFARLISRPNFERHSRSAEVARVIGVLQHAVRRISQGETHLSAKMAVRLGRYFATGHEFWAELQMHHDLAVAARELDLRKIEPLARASPADTAALTGG
jgi:addiction module HigA family antidote